jgi:hypothetical protein
MKRKPATKAELAHLARVKALPCLACRRRFQHGFYDQCGVTEAHHLLVGGRRRGHMHVVSLGSWHHRGQLLPGWTKAEMEEGYGPSLANGSKPFHEAFGSDADLLAETEQLLAKQSVEAA